MCLFCVVDFFYQLQIKINHNSFTPFFDRGIKNDFVFLISIGGDWGRHVGANFHLHVHTTFKWKRTKK